MAVTIALYASEGKDKTLWAWSASEKTYKFGSTSSTNTTIGALISIHSALQTIPAHLDVILRTQDKEVKRIMDSLARIKTKNPVLISIVKEIRKRQGFVRCMFVSSSNLKLDDKRPKAIIQTLTGQNKKPAIPKNSTPKSSLLRPTSGNKTVKATVTRNKKVKQKLTTGLEDWDEGPSMPVVAKPKTVKCESCNAPISPLTNECLCSL